MSQGKSTVEESKISFEGEVFSKELEEIRDRREKRQLYEGDLLPKKEETPLPSANLGLVGLAFSGGGIRSASFALGVVQALARRGVLKYVDYLSTVSGGGYLGACLSSLLNGSRGPSPLEPRNFPLRKELGQPEPPALQHLRNGSNYLSPPGLLNTLRLPTVVLRGVLLTLAFLMPTLLGAVILTGFCYEVLVPEVLVPALEVLVPALGVELIGKPSTLALAAFLVLAPFLVLVVAWPFVAVLQHHRGWDSRNRYLQWTTCALLLALGLLVAWPLAVIVNKAVHLTPGEAHGDLLHFAGSLAMHLGWREMAGAGGLGGFLFWAAQRFEPVKKLLSRLSLLLVALSGPLFLFALFLEMCLWQVTPPRYIPNVSAEKGLQVCMENLRVPESDITTVEAGRLWSAQTGLTSEYSCEWVDGKLQIVGTPFDLKGWILMFMTLLVFVLDWRFLNVNVVSLHGFYRDQLSRVFVVREKNGEKVGVESKEKVDPADALKLSELKGPCAPYHLINATVNLNGSQSPDLRGRQGDFFVFSQHFVGSEHTGWCETTELEKVDPHLNLGTAMAISGAAVAPNMGVFTARAFSFLLMLLNLRLSYWLPNPKRVAAVGRQRWLRRVPGMAYLWKEAMGVLDANGRYVNVSDGGHIENLGVYELLRRRCKFIIAVDGERDSQSRFDGLVKLLRYARIDMGVEIDIGLKGLRADEEGRSEAHWTLGTIRYGMDEVGQLLYIKASLTGDEEPDVLAYRVARPDFPHESTADQFFDETQLEAYRVLGEHITDTLWPKGAVMSRENLVPRTAQKGDGKPDEAQSMRASA